MACLRVEQPDLGRQEGLTERSDTCQSVVVTEEVPHDVHDDRREAYLLVGVLRES